MGSRPMFVTGWRDVTQTSDAAHAIPSGVRLQRSECGLHALVQRGAIHCSRLHEHLHEHVDHRLELGDLVALIAIELEEAKDLLLGRGAARVERIDLVRGLIDPLVLDEGRRVVEDRCER